MDALKSSGGLARNRASREHLFYSVLAVVMALCVLVGFAPSYYMKAHFGAPPQLTPLLQIHGAAFTLWIVLLITQTSLVANDKVQAHRRLGVAGGFLAALMVILATMVAITRFQSGLLGQAAGSPPGPVLLAVALGTVVVFPILIGCALYYRNRPQFHKRLIIIATAELLSAAFGRFPFIGGNPLTFFGATDLIVLALVIHDLSTIRRVHQATLWGGLFLILSQPARLLLTSTGVWLTFAAWLKT
jgi:hypothetical protein